MNKIRINDKVKVLSGKDKGKVGKVVSVDMRLKKAVVEGVNKHTEFRKNNEGQRLPGGIFQVEAPIYLSKLMVVGEDNKASRVVFKVKDNKKTRYLLKAKKNI